MTSKPENLTLLKIQEAFPGAIKGEMLADKVQSILRGEGYTNETTLLATSLCSDEVNRKLEGHFTKIYTSNFNMGGLSGFAHGGVTSFFAMAGHIPKGGNVVIVYGPHVGVDEKGRVGRVNRRGRPGGSDVCCGSATIARRNVLKNNNKKDNTSPPKNATDAQQAFVEIMLQPHANRLACAADIDVELPHALFDAQDEFMKDIIIKDVIKKRLIPSSMGKIALVGGIQINNGREHTIPTPASPRSRPPHKTDDFDDYFLCRSFTILDGKGKELNDHTCLLLNEPDPVNDGKKIADLKTDGGETKIADVKTDGEEIDDGEEIADVKNDDGEEIADLIRAFYEERLMCCAPGGIDGIVQ